MISITENRLKTGPALDMGYNLVGKSDKYFKLLITFRK